ncbi:T9SS type A sorting domain-containing protein [Aquimarina sp. 2201CG5-10]|uniref:T9SS type A sorting domain-containing protein n=1 Tax=Aquimarina callyspongiae TaxID=3098150 RepID=UPI002AB4E117|nr:T9SS type A sorting domain-containing protein [Aquimarina sp. 2201CG5-10]MDY8134565.1 T9SS type A sorting domain-containing protein [Aquimarina sp. 2201CG5-10]
MKNNYIPIKVLIFFFLGITSMMAQQNNVSSGGNATGPSGTSSFSVGQTFYTTTQNASGSLSEGVQQAFEIETLSNPEFELVQLNVSTYPNPTTDRLILSLDEIDITNTSFEIHDIHGRLVLSKAIDSNTNVIEMGAYASGTYILTMKMQNTALKTFKIIKK